MRLRTSLLRPRNFSSFYTAAFLLFALAPSPALFAQPATPPVIDQQPVHGIATTNEDFAFSVTATGTEPLRYQWYLNGSTISGATSSTLLLTNLVLTESGNIVVTVANS